MLASFGRQFAAATINRLLFLMQNIIGGRQGIQIVREVAKLQFDLDAAHLRQVEATGLHADLQKAFEAIALNMLMYISQQLGVPSCVAALLNNLYSSPKQITYAQLVGHSNQASVRGIPAGDCIAVFAMGLADGTNCHHPLKIARPLATASMLMTSRYGFFEKELGKLCFKLGGAYCSGPGYMGITVSASKTLIWFHLLQQGERIFNDT